MNKVRIFSDGGSRGNPGPAAAGVWMETLDKKYSHFLGNGTNNEAEYSALIFGLKKLREVLGKGKAKQTEVECFLDSELVVKQLNHEYKLKEERIQNFFIQIWNLSLDFGKVSFFHIPREKNKMADALVNEALDAALNQKTLI